LNWRDGSAIVHEPAMARHLGASGSRNMHDWLAHRTGHTLNIAHRGGVDAYGPDLLDAVSRSVVAGADAVELDVQTTKDQQLVVFHDRFLRTPAGPRRMGALTLAEAREVAPSGGTTTIPVLAEVLEHVRPLGIRVLLDLKSNDVAEELVRLVTRARVADRVAVSSFHYRPLVGVSRDATGIPTIATIGFARAMGDPRGFLWTLWAMSAPIRAARAIGARALLCQARRLSADFAEAVHAEDLALLAWDVTPSANVGELLQWGVDGIVSSNPTAVRAALNARFQN